MFCKKCGGKIPDESKFCKICGVKLKNQNTLNPLIERSETPIQQVSMTSILVKSNEERTLPPNAIFTQEERTLPPNAIFTQEERTLPPNAIFAQQESTSSLQLSDNKEKILPQNQQKSTFSHNDTGNLEKPLLPKTNTNHQEAILHQSTKENAIFQSISKIPYHQMNNENNFQMQLPHQEINGQNKKKLGQKHIGIITCTTIALIVIGIVIYLFSYSNPEKVLRSYAEGKVRYEYDTMTKYCAYNLDALIIEEYRSNGLSKNEYDELYAKQRNTRNVKTLFAYLEAEEKMDMEEKFGKNYQLAFEILSKDVLSKSAGEKKRNSVIDDFKYRDWDVLNVININGITEMVRYEVKITMYGELKEDSMKEEFILVKIGGKWRVLDDMSGYIRVL